ncbi:hypothetical protein PG990_014803 [Apiospora arundinis]|uniref:FAD/NAD(P)-binding domain-containing protein n=1 Tax=Apiospora arundinis TaxID=335852 RepID=A0ABR2HKD6_9PEZI
MGEVTPLRVLIVGAGSAGLLAAHCLGAENIEYVVFEKDADLKQRPRDWNFGIYWAQSRLDECLPPALKERIQSVQTDPAHVPDPNGVMPVYNAETGELMKDLPAPFSRRLQRKKWIDLLGTGIDIRRGKVLHKIQEDGNTVTAIFTDGTQETGDLLIGAEGAHSLTREYLVGKEEAQLIPSEVVASFSLTKLDKEISLSLRNVHPRYCVLFHPNGTFAFYSVHDATSDDPAQWTWLLTQSWRSSESSHLQGPAIVTDMKERASLFASPFREAFQAIPEGAPSWHNRLSNWPTKPWDNRGGKITLIGDAAHPMTFHRGQGLQNAITDAVSLLQHVREMKAPTREALAGAVKNYEKELWPRGNEAVLASEDNTNMVHDWESMLRSPLFVGGMVRNVTEGS